LANLPTLDLPLYLATAATASTTKTNLTVLEDMCKAFEDANGMHSILSCLMISTLYNVKGGFPTTPTQFPDANPPDYASSRKRPASHPTASRKCYRPSLSSFLLRMALQTVTQNQARDSVLASIAKPIRLVSTPTNTKQASTGSRN
jgi:hypothetical protein